jgi:hypothetical protein
MLTRTCMSAVLAGHWRCLFLQVKYVVELARAISLHPAVHRVELLTRLIADPKVGLCQVSSGESSWLLGQCTCTR